MPDQVTKNTCQVYLSSSDLYNRSTIALNQLLISIVFQNCLRKSPIYNQISLFGTRTTTPDFK